MFNGKLLKQRRELCGLTQSELADKVGTSKQNIYKYETGIVTNIPIPRIEKLATILGVSAEELAGWNEPVSDSSNCTTDELELLSYYRLMPDLDKGRLLGELCMKYGHLANPNQLCP